MERAKREMSFGEEFVYLKEEFEKVIESEDPHSEPKFVNCVLRRAMRCIRKQGEELQAYKDLEEQGKLIKIPFEIGRLLYDITEFKEKHEYPEIYVIDTTSFRLSKDKKGLIYILDSCEYRYEDFGAVLFASKKEAEKALEEMEK